MNRTQLACYSLMASAFVLTAMIFIQASRLMDDAAHAEMVVNRGTVTMMSTAFRTDADIIYVMDSANSRLLAYMVDPNQKVIQLLRGGIMDITREFERQFRNVPGAGGDDDDRRRPR